jgi:hypothetical protein
MELDHPILDALEGKEIQSAKCYEVDYHGLVSVTITCTDGTIVTIGCDVRNGGALITLDNV